MSRYMNRQVPFQRTCEWRALVLTRACSDGWNVRAIAANDDACGFDILVSYFKGGEGAC